MDINAQLIHSCNISKLIRSDSSECFIGSIEVKYLYTQPNICFFCGCAVVDCRIRNKAY